MNDTTLPFDPDQFMNQTIDEPMATQLQSVPAGEYTAMIGDFDSTAFKTVKVTNKTTQLSQDRPVLEVPFLIQDDALKVKLGREQARHTCRCTPRHATGPERQTRSATCGAGPEQAGGVGAVHAAEHGSASYKDRPDQRQG